MLKILVVVGYVVMIVMNYLANALPIGGVTTGQASDAYANLFTPAGITFSIWGLIYLLLFGYTVYQLGIGRKYVRQDEKKVLAKVNKYFFVTTLLNSSWILAWHYGIIWLSVLIMLGLLYYLIKIADVVNKGQYSFAETLFIRAPFSVYFGWITVATIANITVFLVSIGWNGFGISEVTWTSIVLLVGVLIGVLRTLKDRNVFYGMVLVWAYMGILLKHVSTSGFAGKYPSIIATIVLSITIFTSTIVFLLYKKSKKRKVY